MNRYVHGDREVVVHTMDNTIEMPLTKGGPNVKWTRKDARVIVPVTKLPPAMSVPQKPLPPSTPAPAK